MSQKRKIAGLSALGLTTALLIAVSTSLFESSSRITTVLLLIAGLQSMAAFWALAWALKRPGSAFYSIFAGDALLRLAGLGAAVYWLWANSLPYTGVLLSLGFAYLAFSVVQVPFFHKVR